jgi:shikimate 5-dehydrogenase
LQWLNHPNAAAEFAAVLGDPVMHSRTPVEQEEFFKPYGWPVYGIRVEEEEWQEAFGVLRELGLRAAAVTSPLKHEAYLSSTVKTLEAEDLQAVNTLYIDGESMQGHNTDFYGFQTMVKREELNEPVAVWGGGGTLSVIFKVFENAVSFSARTGQPRVKRDVSAFKPKTLIWACGRSEMYKWPLHDWELETVVDMNYTENSMGRELAQALGCRYISGLTMFKAQAEAQRKYWRSFLEGREK